MENQSKSEQAEIDVKVIGLLLAGETSLHVIPTDRKMIESAIQTLNKVPGVFGCAICVKGLSSPVGNLIMDKCNECDRISLATATEKIPSCQYSEMDGFNALSLRTTMNFYGFLILKIEDSGEFQPYAPFVDNFANAISVVIENRQQKSQLANQNKELEKHRNNLEKLVMERTIALERSERLLREVIDNMEKAIAIYDPVNNGEDFRFVDTNEFAEKIMQYNKEDVIGKTIKQLFPGESSIGLIEKFRETYSTGNSTTIPLKQYQDDRITQWVENYIFKLPSGKVVAMFEDTSEKRRMEVQLKTSLKEKETLLSEIHHRVKNNMQIIASLLKLQLSSKDKKDVDSILKENIGRVYAMASIHESLYQSEKLSEIDFKAYLQKLSQMLMQTYAISQNKVEFHFDCPASNLAIDLANPLGLSLNELISNSLKYAFPGERNGTISIKAHITENTCELCVEDDGAGMPETFDWDKIDTLGLKLVRNLVENQLGGSIDLDNTNGTRFTIKFNFESN